MFAIDSNLNIAIYGKVTSGSLPTALVLLTILLALICVDILNWGGGMSGFRTNEPAVFEQGKAIPDAGITLPFWLSYDNRGRLLPMEAPFCFQQSASGEVGKRAGMHGRDFYSGSPIFYAALKI